MKAQLEALRDDAVDLSHYIHAHPELGFEERLASTAVADMLRENAFDVTGGLVDLPTAVHAVHGDGPLRIGIFAEYDALPEIGHACGHNIIAAAGVTAARLLAPRADRLGITVELFGTPAEEHGGGKVLMLDRGAFDGLHVAMMVHPSPADLITLPALAVDHVGVRYAGRTAHASGSPTSGRNAADALTIAQVAVGLLRQHLPGDVQFHGIVTDGGEAPNIVPGHTAGQFYIRAGTQETLAEAYQRIRECFAAGALATGCTMTFEREAPTYTELRGDPEIEGLYRTHAEALGRRLVELPPGFPGGGSTDMGNVSLAMPVIHPCIALDTGGASNHQPEFTDACNQPSADQAVLDGAIAMARTAVDLATTERIRRRLLAR